MPFKSEILREAIMENQLAHIDQPAYSVCRTRRAPILVCPHCKRAVMDFSFTSVNKDGRPFDVWRCKERGDVVAIWSEVVNEY